MRQLSIPIALVCAVLAGCAAPRPVLYPNQKLERVGRAVADSDLEECRRLAANSGAAMSDTEKAGEAARETAERAGAGAATGAVGGAIRGGNVGIAAAAGAAMAATWGFVRGGFRWLFGARDPDPIERRFVERCLADRGYDVIGWR